MKKMADKDELEFMKWMQDRKGFESQLKDPVQALAEAKVNDRPVNVPVPEMNEEKALQKMKQAGQAVYGAADEMSPRMKALKTLGRKAAGVLGPAIGLGAALSSGDVSAAIPVLNSAESVGMSPEAEDQMIAETQAKIDYSKSSAARDRLAALAKLSKLQE